MKLGLLEIVLISFTGLLIFGTKRLGRLKESLKKAADEFKVGMDQKD